MQGLKRKVRRERRIDQVIAARDKVINRTVVVIYDNIWSMLIILVRNCSLLVIKERIDRMLLIIIFSIIQSTAEANCPALIEIYSPASSSYCAYHYALNNNQTCSFVKCQHSAQQQQPKAFTWQQCYSSCCSFQSSLPNQSDQIGLLLQCQTNSNANRILSIGLIIGLTFGSILLVLVLVSCLKNEKCILNRLCRKWCCKRKENIGESQVDVTNNQVQEKDEPVVSQIYLNLSHIPVNTNIFKSKCFICQQTKPNLQIPCNHHLHANCLTTPTPPQQSPNKSTSSLPTAINSNEQSLRCTVCNEQLSIVNIYCTVCKSVIRKVAGREIGWKKAYSETKKAWKCNVCS